MWQLVRVTDIALINISMLIAQQCYQEEHDKFSSWISSVIRALCVLAKASTQCCTFQSWFCILALALLCATLLALAGPKLLADFGCFREHCSEGLVHLVAGLDPLPVSWRAQYWCRNQRLAPYMPAQVHSTSDVLLEGGTCRWYELDIALLGKQFAACLVHIG